MQWDSPGCVSFILKATQSQELKCVIRKNSLESRGCSDLNENGIQHELLFAPGFLIGLLS